MALTTCKDCGNQVSNSAVACPKCGAPVPRIIGTDQEQCPFCETVLSRTATVCSGCRAQKGYSQVQGNVYGKKQMVARGIILPIALILIAMMFNSTFGTIILFIMLIPILLSFHRLRKGEMWFRSANIHTG